MFCPKCGKAEQTPESYCRQCGIFLPDLSKPGKAPVRPEDHVKANAFLSALTIATAFTLSLLLYWRFLGKPDTPIIIYVTAGFLIAIGCWQIQTLWRSLLLRKHFNKNKRGSESSLEFQSPANEPEQLGAANMENIVPMTITEDTTKNLVRKT